MKNVLMYDNNATDEGGAILTNNLNTFLSMHNCTVTENTSTSISASRHGGLQNKTMGSGTIKNCIFWNNTRADISSPSLITVSFSIVDNGGVASTYVNGGSVLTVDPLFMSAPTDDFRLLNGTSPAVNAGTFDAGLAPLGDLVATTRLGLPDLGAYELSAATILPRDCPNQRIIILPIRLSSFALECGTQGTMASWKADSEADAPAFWIEGSADGNAFTRVTEASPAGRPMHSGAYQMTLPSKSAQYQYFRLASQDADGQTVAYSPIVEQAPCNVLAMNLLIYPTIVHSLLKFELRSPEETTFDITVTDLAGRLMHQAQFAGSSLLVDRLDVQVFPAGIYFFRVQDAHGNVAVQRFVRQ